MNHMRNRASVLLKLQPSAPLQSPSKPYAAPSHLASAPKVEHCPAEVLSIKIVIAAFPDHMVLVIAILVIAIAFPIPISCSSATLRFKGPDVSEVATALRSLEPSLRLLRASLMPRASLLILAFVE